MVLFCYVVWLFLVSIVFVFNVNRVVIVFCLFWLLFMGILVNVDNLLILGVIILIIFKSSCIMGVESWVSFLFDVEYRMGFYIMNGLGLFKLFMCVYSISVCLLLVMVFILMVWGGSLFLSKSYCLLMIEGLIM